MLFRSRSRAEQSRAEHNIWLDFWKFYMSIIIVIFHYNCFYLGGQSEFLCRGGYICVDAFFVISGFFCAKILLNKKCTMKEFIGKRYKKLYPYYMLSLIFAVISMILLDRIETVPFKLIVAAAIEEVLCVQEWGFLNLPFSFNGITWYVSAMLLVAIIFCSICKYIEHKNIQKVIAFFMIICAMIIFFKFGHLDLHGVLKFHFPVGVARGILGMGVGWFTYCYKDNLLSIISKFSNLFAVSIFLFTVLTVYTKNGISDFIVYPLSVIILIASYRLPRKIFFDYPCFKYLGNLSYMIYLIHITLFNLLSKYIIEFNVVFFTFTSVLLSIVFIRIMKVIANMYKVVARKI